MKITRIETIPVQVPIHPQRAIRASRGTHSVSPFLLIKIHTSDGLIGLGEVSCTPRWSGEDQVTAAHFVASILEPLLKDQDPTHIERLTAMMRTALAGNTFTKAGLEMALWDLLGKVAGLPVYALLGGPVRDWVPTKFSVSGLAPEAAAEIAMWACAQGFNTMKVKVGIEPDGDVARARAVRQAIGPAVRLGVDANGGWPSPRVAVPTINRLVDAADIYFAEQPVPPLDVAWLAEVRARVPVPVIADESLYSLQDGMALAGRAPRTCCRSTLANPAALVPRARSPRSPKRPDWCAPWAATWSWGSAARRWPTWRWQRRASAPRSIPATS